MSGFEASWLDLREPADHAARDAGLLRRVRAMAAAGQIRQVVDLGCGTGSSFRALDLPALPWCFVDNDPVLLAETARRAGTGRETLALDLAGPEAGAALPLAPGVLLTASALFDLCSERFVQALAARIAASGAPAFYAALSYDGRISWSEPLELDGPVVAAFNRHQTGDKGFGPALGPAAASRLAAALASGGFDVALAESDWQMGPDEAALQRAFLDGLVAAVRETGEVEASALARWQAARLLGIDGGVRCRVGHLDLLAERRAQTILF